MHISIGQDLIKVEEYQSLTLLRYPKRIGILDSDLVLDTMERVLNVEGFVFAHARIIKSGQLTL